MQTVTWCSLNKCRELKSESKVATTVEEVKVSAAPDEHNSIYEEIPRLILKLFMHYKATV